MHDLPLLSAQELISALEKSGFSRHSQRGSHIKLRHPDGRTAIIPNHKQIKIGTLKKGILQPLGISAEEIKKLLKS